MKRLDLCFFLLRGILDGWDRSRGMGHERECAETGSTRVPEIEPISTNRMGHS